MQIYEVRVVNVWQDNRNGNFDIYCNIRSYNNPDTIVSVNQFSAVIPRECRLFQNYPNPFNPVTHLEFEISKLGFVSLKAYDILGKEVKTLVNEIKPAGIYKAQFNGSNLSSGVYFYKIDAGDFTMVRRMVLIK